MRTAARTGPDPALLAELEKVQGEAEILATLRAQEAPRIMMRYSDPERTATVDGEALPEGAAVPIFAETIIGLPGLGVMTLHPGAGSDLSLRLARAEAELAALCARADSADIGAARLAAARRGAAAAELAAGEGRIRLLAPAGVDALRTEMATMPEPPADPPPGLTGATAELLVDEAVQRQKAADTAAEAARTNADAARLTEARAEVEARGAASAAESAAAHLAAFGDTETADLRAAAALHACEMAVAQATARHRALSETAPDLPAADAAVARARAVIAGAERETRQLAEERGGLDTEIDLRFGEGVEEERADVTQRLQAAEATRAALVFEQEVLTALIAALDTARAAARTRYFDPVMVELRPLLRLLWPAAELNFDGDSLLPTALLRDGVAEEIGILSGGTQEQVALLVRLAFARLLARSGRCTPVILDDALVHTDDDRIERMFDALHAQAQDQQIIVLSCRQRAFRDLGGRALSLEPA